MREALKAGASMINDVEALGAPGALEAVAQSECAVCLMHKKGDPATMQRDPHYEDLVGEVKAYLTERVKAATRAAGAEHLAAAGGRLAGKEPVAASADEVARLESALHLEVLELKMAAVRAASRWRAVS